MIFPFSAVIHKNLSRPLIVYLNNKDMGGKKAMVVQVGKGIFWVVDDIRFLQKGDGSIWLVFDERMVELNWNQIRAFGFEPTDFIPDQVGNEMVVSEPLE